MTDRIEVPQTRAQLRDMAWALANGTRLVHDLEYAAEQLLGALDRADQKQNEGAEQMVDYYRQKLEEAVGHERRTHKVVAREYLAAARGDDPVPEHLTRAMLDWCDRFGIETNGTSLGNMELAQALQRKRVQPAG